MAIFVNYRREDSESITGRIDDYLRARFGDDDVYRDIDSIPLGVDFVEHLNTALDRCDLCVAIIGRTWVSSRLLQPNDFVRRELEQVLKRGVPLIPVLVERAHFPKPEELPDSLQPLLLRQALVIDSGTDFRPHVERLADAIRRIRKSRPSRALPFSGSRVRSFLSSRRSALILPAILGLFAAAWLVRPPPIPVPVPTPSADERPGSGGTPALEPGLASQAPVSATTTTTAPEPPPELEPATAADPFAQPCAPFQRELTSNETRIREALCLTSHPEPDHCEALGILKALQPVDWKQRELIQAKVSAIEPMLPKLTLHSSANVQFQARLSYRDCKSKACADTPISPDVPRSVCPGNVSISAVRIKDGATVQIDRHLKSGARETVAVEFPPEKVPQTTAPKTVAPTLTITATGEPPSTLLLDANPAKPGVEYLIAPGTHTITAKWPGGLSKNLEHRALFGPRSVQLPGVNCLEDPTSKQKICNFR